MIFRTILEDYNTRFFSYSPEYVNSFMSFASSNLLDRIIELSYISSNKGRNEVPLNNANVKQKNLIYTFKSKVFLEYINFPDEIPMYANAYWHFTMLVLLTMYVREVTNNNLVRLSQTTFNNYISLNILSGFEASVEFKMTEYYGEIFEELAQFKPKNKFKMKVSPNEEKQIIEFFVKNNDILTMAFQREGYKKVQRNSHALDWKSKSELRIMKGKTPCSIRMKLFTSGMRSISRMLSLNSNPDNKIYLRDFWVRGGIFTSNLVSFYFRAIIQNCHMKFEKSNFRINQKFIDDYVGKRNVGLKTAVIILLVALPENKQKKLIDNIFKKEDYKQKKSIWADIENLKNVIAKKKVKTPATVRLYHKLGRKYGW